LTFLVNEATKSQLARIIVEFDLPSVLIPCGAIVNYGQN